MSAPADLTRPFVIRDFGELRRTDTALAGGKGANLGELQHAGFPVPPGFVITAAAYAAVRDDAGIGDQVVMALDAWAARDDGSLDQVTATIREAIRSAAVPAWLRDAIVQAHHRLTGGDERIAVAVRSSTTVEDAPSAWGAGMTDPFHTGGGPDDVVDAVRRCWASLFDLRSVSYRTGRGFDETAMGIAVVVQRLIPATRSGVLFTVDPASGDRDRMIIEAARGLGESVVSGRVVPDRYVVEKDPPRILSREQHEQAVLVLPRDGGGTTSRAPRPEDAGRPALDDGEVMRLAHAAVRIEQHYGFPQDVEWALDPDGALWVLQSRPVTTSLPPSSPRDRPGTPAPGTVLARGLGAAPGRASGSARIVASDEDAADIGPGDVVVTRMTSADWVPAVRRAAAIVTDIGGMASHAATVARELGIPCVVGTAIATTTLPEWETITVDATYGTVTAGPRTAAPPGEDSR